jgi:hypothetical protein
MFAISKRANVIGGIESIFEEGIDVTQFQSIITEHICNLVRKTNIIVLVDRENYSLLRIL